METAFKWLDAAALDWLFARENAGGAIRDSFRMPGVPALDAKRRLAIDVLIGQSHGLTTEAIVERLRSEVLAPLRVAAEGAIGDLAASKHLRDDRKTGSVVVLAYGAPRRSLVENCLELYRHYGAELPPATGTWNDQPAVRLIINVYRLATGIDLSGKQDGGTDGLIEAYPMTRLELAALDQSTSPDETAAAKAGLQKLLDDGSITKADAWAWLRRSTSVENLRVTAPSTLKSRTDR